MKWVNCFLGFHLISCCLKKMMMVAMNFEFCTKITIAWKVVKRPISASVEHPQYLLNKPGKWNLFFSLSPLSTQTPYTPTFIGCGRINWFSMPFSHHRINLWCLQLHQLPACHLSRSLVKTWQSSISWSRVWFVLKVHSFTYKLSFFFLSWII